MRNVFLFIRRHFNFLFFLVLQIVALSFLFRYNKFHEAAFLSVSTELTGRLNAKYNNIEYYFQLRKTNEALVQENLQLRQQLRDNFEAPDTAQRLFRDTIRTDSVRKWEVMEAKVVSNTIALPANYLTIHRGFKQGVRANMGVAGPKGLVGQVINVSENFAIVMSMLHPQFKVIARLKKGGDNGTVFWDGLSPNYFTMRGIPRSANVAVGDTVLTSQITYLFPANMMVGTISEIIPDNTTNFYTLKLRSATNFSNLEYAYVLDNLQAGEQRRLEDSTRKKLQ
ncbi:MAG TPA: rod shape-determining protein MreC [Puia sp.]|nr:rod shape-determining protein MreC [Puia sp.]